MTFIIPKKYVKNNPYLKILEKKNLKQLEDKKNLKENF